MSDILSIVTFKWRDPNYRYNELDHSTARHVNILFNMLRRNMKVPFQPVCITDDPSGLDPDIRVIKLWDKHRDLGGCWNRLYIFSEDMKDLIGNRFAYMDVDTVITGDVTPIFSRPDPIIGWKAPRGHFGGGFWLMDAGIKDSIWSNFNADKALSLENFQKKGWTDQAWINHCLQDEDVPAIGPDDGVYLLQPRNGNFDMEDNRYPENMTMAFFAGPRDPTDFVNVPWVKENWK